MGVFMHLNHIFVAYCDQPFIPLTNVGSSLMTPNALVQLTHRQILEVILRVTRSLILYKVYKKIFTCNYIFVITVFHTDVFSDSLAAQVLWTEP